MDLLVSCDFGGDSTSSKPPRYLRAMHDGRMLFEHTAGSLLGIAERVCFSILREHDDRFGASGLIREAIPAAEVSVSDQPNSRARSANVMLEQLEIRDPFLIKSVYSGFACSGFNPHKFFERNCIFVSGNRSRLGYLFSDSGEYRRALASVAEPCIDAVVDEMIQCGSEFLEMECSNCVGFDTDYEWVKYRQRFATYIFDLDGVLVENGSPHFFPKWGEAEAIQASGEAVRGLYAHGNHIVIMTARPESYREMTEAELQDKGIPYHQLVMGVHHGRRYIVNDYSANNPCPSAVAVNTVRDSGDFAKKLNVVFPEGGTV